MKRTARKLTLRKESLRLLDSSEGMIVRGGASLAETCNNTNCFTCFCESTIIPGVPTSTRTETR